MRSHKRVLLHPNQNEKRNGRFPLHTYALASNVVSIRDLYV